MNRKLTLMHVYVEKSIAAARLYYIKSSAESIFMDELRLIILSGLILFLHGCVAGPAYDFWGVTYRSTEQHVGVVDLVIRGDLGIIYRQHSVQPNGELTRYHGESYGGAMPRPTTFYVKWVDESTGISHEQQIELRGLLPEGLDSEDFILVFDENEVYVFAAHIASATAGHPLKVVPALQLFPDPAVKPFTGVGRPTSSYSS